MLTDSGSAVGLHESRTALAALGRRVDELARDQAPADVLDGLLAAMRLHHERITRHLAAATGMPAARGPRRSRSRHLRVA